MGSIARLPSCDVTTKNHCGLLWSRQCYCHAGNEIIKFNVLNVSAGRGRYSPEICCHRFNVIEKISHYDRPQTCGLKDVDVALVRSCVDICHPLNKHRPSANWDAMVAPASSSLSFGVYIYSQPWESRQLRAFAGGSCDVFLQCTRIRGSV